MKNKKREKIICNYCGVEMNFHAEKINYSKINDVESDVNNNEDELIDEIHTCPECGKSESRSGT